MRNLVYLVSVDCEHFSSDNTSNKINLHNRVFLNKIQAQDAVDYYSNEYKSNPNKVYYIELKCLVLE